MEGGLGWGTLETERNEWIWDVCGGRMEVYEEGVILLRGFVLPLFLIEINAFRAYKPIHLLTSSKYGEADLSRI